MLWGDVPALMPMTKAVKVSIQTWSDYGKPGYKAQAFNGQTASVEGMKNTGGSWFCVDPRGNRVEPNNARDEGVKGFTPNGEPLGQNMMARQHGSKSKARKAASAAIAKIPISLARHIAAYWKPVEHRMSA